MAPRIQNLLIFTGFLARVGFFLFGIYQDATMEVKYTDIDYMVFTDASRYVYTGQSPYDRETYRYTPLLAWLLVPSAIKTGNTILDTALFSFGKLVFVVSDLITGVLILKLLNYLSEAQKQHNKYRNLILTSIWLLNPMVITISTRGSSESLLSVLILLFVYYLVVAQNYALSGVFYALSIHFKIYPIIYLPSIALYLNFIDTSKPPLIAQELFFILFNKLFSYKKNKPFWHFMIATGIVTISLTGLMYHIYGYEFLYNSYFYHLIRTDHRHNFSVYNISLYFSSAMTCDSSESLWGCADFTKLAFVPQFFISAIMIPIIFNANFNYKIKEFNSIYKLKSIILVSTLFVQTFAFVNYNKVITSQYFIWYLMFLPNYLQFSSFKWNLKSLAIIAVWVLSQALWLANAYRLEFLGQSVFYPELFFSSVVFFAGNCWILQELIKDMSISYWAD